MESFFVQHLLTLLISYQYSILFSSSYVRLLQIFKDKFHFSYARAVFQLSGPRMKR